MHAAVAGLREIVVCTGHVQLLPLLLVWTRQRHGCHALLMRRVHAVQVWGGALSAGPNNRQLQGTFDHTKTTAYQVRQCWCLIGRHLLTPPSSNRSEPLLAARGAMCVRLLAARAAMSVCVRACMLPRTVWMQDEVLAALLGIAPHVPGGMLVFLPSYSLLRTLVARWQVRVAQRVVLLQPGSRIPG